MPGLKSIRSVLPAIAAGLALALLGGCATGPQVRTSIDRTANFAQYRSFGFVSPLGTDRGGYQSLISQRLTAAARRELEARGLRYDPAAPQLLVNFNAQLADKLRVSSAPSTVTGVGYGRGYYGYRRGYYTAWTSYSEPTVTQYKEGTLNVDVVDATRKQLVWEAIVTDSVTSKDIADPAPALDAAVGAAFAKFPATLR